MSKRLSRKGLLALGGCLFVVAASLLPMGGGLVADQAPRRKVKTMDLSSFSADAPESPIDLVFLHHSVGGQLLADKGSADDSGSVHPNGGGLRRMLEDRHYLVHQATYGSRLGERTDLFDWLPKFRVFMSDVLRIAEQDQPLPDGQVNRVVLFKSCYPNNLFEGDGGENGNPDGPRLTLANAKATLRALLPIFAKYPDTLFVYLTTPPLIGIAHSDPAIKWLAKRVLGKPTTAEKLARQGQLSRDFANWVAAEDGWRKDYALANFVVFDYYDLLTDEGASNFLRYPSGDGLDNHPNADGNRKAALALVPFLNQAVRRAGLAAR